MPSLRLVGALEAFPELDQAGRVDLHLDVRVRGLERAGHLGGDALAHLGHRDQDLVHAGRERDRTGGPALGGSRRGGRGRRGGCGGAAAAAAAGRRVGRRSSGPLDVGEHVLARDPPTATGPGDAGGLEAVLPEETADRGRHAGVGIAGGRSRRGGSGRRRRARRRPRLRAAAGRRRRAAARRRRGGCGGGRRAAAAGGGRRGCAGPRAPPAPSSSSVSITAISALFGTVGAFLGEDLAQDRPRTATAPRR